MEPIRFADILFTALTLLIIYVILYYVNKSKRKNIPPGQGETTPDSEPDHDINDRMEEQNSN